MSDSGDKKVVVVIPFLNEEETLPELYRRLVAVLEREPERFEIFFVDDGSTDGSAAWAAQKAREDHRVKLLRLSRNFGHQIAITAGLDHADGDAVVVMDADLQDPPEVIPELLARWREGYEVVYAVRRVRAGETWLKKFLASGFYRLFHKVAEVEVPMEAGDFRLLDRKVVAALREVRELHRFMRGLTSWVGFRQGAVEFERAPRWAGKTKYPVWRSVKLAWDALTSFSGAPLRWMTGMGLLVSLGGLGLAGRVIWSKLTHPGTLMPGWTSLMAAVLLLGGLQLVSIGLMGQYVSRIFEEAKKRPLYFVRERIGDFPARDAADAGTASRGGPTPR